MGWLGWSYERAMQADVCIILLAHQGKVEMLKAIFGSTDEPTPDELPPFRPGLL